MAAKIDAALKLSVVASLLIAASGVAYYYALYLPGRDDRIDHERASEILLAYGERRVEEERSAAQQRQLAERRAADQAAAEVRYQTCLDGAHTRHDRAWEAACKRLADHAERAHADCLTKKNLSQIYCDASYRALDGSATCTLPVEIATDIDGDLNTALNRCLRERNAALR